MAGYITSAVLIFISFMAFTTMDVKNARASIMNGGASTASALVLPLDD